MLNGQSKGDFYQAGTQAEENNACVSDVVEIEKREIIDILKTLEGLKRKLQPKLK